MQHSSPGCEASPGPLAGAGVTAPGLAPPSAAAGKALVPLVVDIDGTLIRSDLLVETGLAFLARQPFSAWKLALWLKGGKARLKAELARRASPDIAHLPLNEEVVAYIRAAEAGGCAVHLASAADRRLVEALAARVGAEREVFASDGATNLVGRHKAAALVARFGRGGFDYIGNEQVDFEVWEQARRAICASHSRGFAGEVAARFGDAEHIATKGDRLVSYLRALRPERWARNALLAVPMLVAGELGAGNLALLALAFVAFSLVGSATYLINDIADLDADRRHQRKRHRPLASGSALLLRAVPLIPALALAGLVVAALVSLAFLASAVAYLVLGLAYSLYLKCLPILGVLALAGLLLIRIVAGGIAIGVGSGPIGLVVCALAAVCLAVFERRR